MLRRDETLLSNSTITEMNQLYSTVFETDDRLISTNRSTIPGPTWKEEKMSVEYLHQQVKLSIKIL